MSDHADIVRAGLIELPHDFDCEIELGRSGVCDCEHGKRLAALDALVAERDEARRDAIAVREKMHHNAANLDFAIQQRMAAETERDNAVAALERMRLELVRVDGLLHEQKIANEGDLEASVRYAARAERAEAENARLREALEQIADAFLRSMPGINPDGSLSTSSMAETLARAALGEERI